MTTTTAITTATTTTILWPCRDYSGETAPEETFLHPVIVFFA